MGKKKNKDKVGAKTAFSVIEKNKGKCENPKCWRTGNQLHHIFFKSQYFAKDRNTGFNLANLCYQCHDLVHHTGKKEGAILNWYLKNKAYQKYNGIKKAELGLCVIRAHYKTK